MTDAEIKPQENLRNQLENPAPAVRTIRSEDLLQGAQEIFIEHDGETYRLRLTRNHKLILQK